MWHELIWTCEMWNTTLTFLITYHYPTSWDENNSLPSAISEQFNIINVANHFHVCLTYFRSNKAIKGCLCLTLKNVNIFVATNLLLGDKQARRDVYIMVYGISSHLINLLATGILSCYGDYICGMLDIWLATFNNLFSYHFCINCINMSDPTCTIIWQASGGLSHYHYSITNISRK